MTTTQLATVIRFKTKTNSTTFADADILVLANLFIAELASMIVEKNAGYFLLPTTFDLVANQREYSFDSTILNRIHKLELKFSANDSRFPSIGVKDYEGSETESEIVKNYSNESGGFAHYIRRQSLFILSGTIPAVTGGGRLWWYKYPVDLSALNGSTDMAIDPSTTTFGFPKQFHELLARRVAMEYKSRQPKPIPFSALDNNYYNDLQVQLNAISTNDDSMETIGLLPNAADHGNDGFDY